MIGFIAPYTFKHFGPEGNHSAIAVQHTLQFAVAHALGLSVFISSIQATDLSQSHCNFNSHMKSSWHFLIPFCHFFSINFDCHLQNSIQFSSDYCSVLHRTPHLTLVSCPTLLITTLPGPHGRHRVYSFVACNGCQSIVACTCVVGMCLPTCCLATSIHITIF
jgi:hypothetical protein